MAQVIDRERSKARNILAVAFKTEEIGEMRAAGINVVAALHVAGRKERDPLPELEIYPYYAAIRCEIDVPASVNFSAALRRRLYDECVHMFRRHYLRLAFVRSRALRSWTDLDNLFYIAANFYFDLLTRADITDIVFTNFPHEGSCIILYRLARLLGIRTIIPSQSAFPSRMWIMRDLDDFGYFETVKGGGQPLKMPEKPKVPFYMKGASPYRQLVRGGSIAFREGAKLAGKYITLQFLYNRDAVDRNLNRLIRATDQFGSGHPSVGDEQDVDLSVPFVYFALHLQPEMTTDTWGFEYGDQLLAIEELAAALGEGIKIYVKENPKQTRYMREPSFFRRLRAIPNVHYIKPTVTSFELIERSLCVATISGTVGWEALLMGKGVIHFGITWYARIPGAFRWAGPETLGKAIAFEQDRDALQAAFDQLSRKTYPGVIDRYFGQIVDGYDSTKEIRQAIASIATAMDE